MPTDKVYDIYIFPLIDECMMLLCGMTCKSPTHVFLKGNKYIDTLAGFGINFRLDQCIVGDVSVRNLFWLFRTLDCLIFSIS